MLTVAAVDPRDVTRDALCKTLALTDNKMKLLSFSSSPDALASDAAPFNVFMLHVGSYSFQSDWVQRELLVIRPTETPIALLCDNCELTEVAEAMSLGASGYILTSFSPKVVTCAVRIVAEGGEFIPAETLLNGAPHQVSSSQSSDAAPSVKTRNPVELIAFLSPQQRLVLHHLYYGKTNQQIAKEIGISVSTVKIHVRNIMRKLNVHNRTHACAAALQMVHQ